jgi:membrane associated rhomboid family serine protease
MIPLTDKNPTHRFPAVTIALIIVNAGVFLYEVSLGERIESFLQLFGAIPREIVSSLTLRDFIPGILVPMATSMFVHGGWIHLIGNMLYLWVFGDNVEDKLGRLRYLIFYLICGFAASGLHVLLDPHSSMPMVGASGAISGVLGAYLLMFPRARVVTLIPIFFFIQIAELPALVVLGLWFVMQFFNGVLSLGQETGGMGGVAWWAHVGGFVTGLALLYPFRRFR